MTKEERIKTYDDATELWGLVAQYDQCLEEMAELMIAINKYKRKKFYGEYENDLSIEQNLAEEITDVSLCIEQMKHFFDKFNFDEIFEEKMRKFKKQIEKQKAKKYGK